MTLDTMTFEEEPIIFSREKKYVFEIPLVDINQHGNCSIRYVPLEFKTLEFYGEVYRIQ